VDPKIVFPTGLTRLQNEEAKQEICDGV